jgi:hypothetical protein
MDLYGLQQYETAESCLDNHGIFACHKGRIICYLSVYSLKWDSNVQAQRLAMEHMHFTNSRHKC